MSILDNIAGALGLNADVNKAKGKGDEDHIGAVGELLPELKLSISDEDLISLTDKWELNWKSSPIRSKWLEMAEENENYWKGKQFSKIGSEVRPLQDNIVFEGTETFLPAATRQNPEPLVELKSTEEKSEQNLKYAEIIRNRLADWADETKLRLKIKKAGRHWFISLVGIGKMGWDIINDRPALKIVRAKKLILDPDSVTDEDGYTGKYIGELRKLEASVLIELTEDEESKQSIREEVNDKMGTDIQFVEWWTNDYMCWIFKKNVLLKKKNPHWNYKPEENQTQEESAEPILSPFVEQPQTPEEPKPNHFASKKMPYVFLTVFNLGKTPVDENSLITQTLPQQDVVNKRLKQIDGNADNMNTGMVVSEERSGLTKDEATQVSTALKKGGTVVIPTGAPGDAVARFPAPPLPTDIYNNLIDQRNRFRDILGITGMTPAGIKNDDTVRGKIITRGLDTDRIGGGITEYFEQFADDIFNWVVHLYYVYDEIFANSQGAKVPQIKVSVKEGSLLPKDATTKANQAIELANAGKMALIDLYKALEYPNPEEMAANVWIESTMPWVLFKDNEKVKEVMQMMQQQSQGEEKPPSESISFKDLPPEGKVQMAKQAGIEIAPEQIQAEDVKQEMKEINKDKRSILSKVLLKDNKKEKVKEK